MLSLNSMVVLEPMNWRNQKQINWLYAVRTHPKVVDNYFSPPPQTFAEHSEFLKNVERSKNWKFFILKNEDQFVGYCQIVKRSEGIEIGIALHPDWWGKGIGSKSVQLLLLYIEKHMQIGQKIIFLRVKSNNTAAIRIYKKNNFLTVREKKNCTLMQFKKNHII